MLRYYVLNYVDIAAIEGVRVKMCVLNAVSLAFVAVS